MRSVLIMIVLSVTSVIGVAQISKQQEKRIQNVHQLQVRSMPKINNEFQIEKELSQRGQASAPNFAVSIDVNFNPDNSGEWEYINDTAIWRLVLESRGAHSLNLGFTNFYLPSSSSLYIYDYYKREKIRPFIPADNDEHEQLWTPIITSDKIIIEVNIAKKDIASLKLQLNHVNHDFMDIQKSLSDACHIDVSCGAVNGYPDIENYRDQIRSVGMYTLGGTSICSGFLINNTKQDCRPYFITANHCNLTAFNAATMVTYWNYENSYCREPGSNASAAAGDGLLNSFNSGAVLKAAWAESDFTLVELDDEVPKEANAYFCGWDISSNPPDRGVVIHHPNLEEKRISFKYESIYTGRWGQQASPIANGDHLIVNKWDLGSTEDGSSGAPLFNRQGLVVGQLHGGLASCGNQEYDAFGRLFSSWTGGGMPTNRLKDWLDPDNLGLLNLQGKNCVFDVKLSQNDFTVCGTDGFFEVFVEVDDSFQGPVQLTFEALPNGAFAFFDQAFVMPGQVSKLTFANLNALSIGDYTLDIVATDQTRSVKTQLRFVLSTQLGEVPALLFPEDNKSVDVDKAELQWMGSNILCTYKIQLASDQGFTMNLEEQYSDIASFDLGALLEVGQTYFWRVKAVNACGESEWSEINRFSTIDISCWGTKVFDEIPIGSQEPNTIYSTILNTTPGQITSLVIKNIKGKHSFVSDLRMSIISPNGTELILMDEQCSSSKDFNFGFSDDGLSKFPCPLTDLSLYRPLDKLSKFNGEPALGEWILKIEDKNTYDGGLLEEWTIEICVDPAIDYSLSAEVNALDICSNESYNIPLLLGSNYDPNSTLRFESNIPTLAQVNKIGEELILQINSTGMASPGNYPIEITVDDDNGNVSKYKLSLEVILKPTELDLLLPLDEENNVPVNGILNWSVSTYASEYIIEMANNPDFSDFWIVDTVSINAFTFDNPLESDLTYYWRIHAMNRCGVETSPIYAFTTEMTNGVSQQEVQLIDFYPNPTQDHIYIVSDWPIGKAPIEIAIHSLDGKLIHRASMSGTQTSISVSSWPKGMYLISAKYESQIQMSRIVVQ